MTNPTDKTKLFRLTKNVILLQDNGKPMMYSSDEVVSGNIVHPQGAKVVHLFEHPSKENLVCILCFWEKKYRKGYLSKEVADVSKDFSGYNADSAKIFLNDFYHLLYVRLENYKPQKELLDLQIKMKEKYEILEKDKSFNSNRLQLLIQRYNKEFKIDKTNKVKTLDNFIEGLTKTKIFNPGEVFEKVFIPRLAWEWFDKDHSSDLYKFYTKYILGNKVFNQSFLYDVGEVYQDSTLYKNHTEFVNVIFKLKKEISSRLKDNSPETKWLKSNHTSNLKSVLRNTYASIVLGNQMWDLSSEIPIPQISGIAVNDFAGSFRPQPFITILLHEMNVITHLNIGAFFKPPSETHIQLSEHFGEIENYINGSLDINNPKDPRQIDAIFQSHSYMSLVNLALLLK